LEKLLKVLLLKDQWILAQVEEIEDITFGDPDCILHDPMSIQGDQLTDWLPFATKKEAVIRSSDIITFVDPSDDIIAMYRNGKTELLTE
jgi:hypothetical protein